MFGKINDNILNMATIRKSNLVLQKNKIEKEIKECDEVIDTLEPVKEKREKVNQIIKNITNNNCGVGTAISSNDTRGTALDKCEKSVGADKVENLKIK